MKTIYIDWVNDTNNYPGGLELTYVWAYPQSGIHPWPAAKEPRIVHHNGLWFDENWKMVFVMNSAAAQVNRWQKVATNAFYNGNTWIG